MKIYNRLLLTVPFAIVTYGFCKFNDPDDKCSGIADLITEILFYVALLVTVIFAFIGALRNRPRDKFRFSPVSLAIIIFSILALVYNSSFRGHTKGDIWLNAESKISTKISGQDLTLRKNGNFTFKIIDFDFSCSISGKYKKNGDTILFEKETVDKTALKLARTYLFRVNMLVPISDTTNKVIFKIVSTK